MSRGPELEFRALVNAVKDYAIFMLDPAGRVLTWNEGARALKGYEADEIIGQPHARFYPPEGIAEGRPGALLAAAERDGHIEDVGWRVRKDGTRFWADVVITAVRGGGGELVGFLKVTRDLSERKEVEERLRESEERTRLLLASVVDYAIFMLGPDGHVMTWNLGAERIKGFRAGEIIGQHFSRFYPLEDIAAGKPARELEIARTTGRYEDEGWRLRKDGTRFWASVVLTAVYEPSGALRGFAKVTRDLTERRENEQQLRAAAVESARASERALNAEDALRQREEFISIAAHELRTPLTTLSLKLQGLTRLVKRELDACGPAAEKVETRLEDAVRQVDRFADLVERLLDMSHVVGGELVIQPEPTDLATVAREIVGGLHEQAEQARSPISLTVHGDVDGTWDRRRVEQALTNLIGNAIKYGAGKPIDILVEQTGDDGEGVRIVVCDRGIGIASADIDRIFGRFERAVPLRHYAGLGLGLYITRHIIEAHGGTIRVDSTLGEGARFIVELPRHHVHAAVPAVVTNRGEHRPREHG